MTFLAVFNFLYEVELLPRRATKSEGCFAVLMGYCEITHSENIHPDKNVDASVKRNLSNAHHGEHNPIRERDVDEMRSCGQRPATDANILSTYGS
jgi:hypothetical protein